MTLSEKNPSKTEAVTRAFCCAAVDSVSDNDDEGEPRRAHIREYQPLANSQERRANGWPSLTPSDMFELQSIVPTPQKVDRKENDAKMGGNTTPTSMVKLLKKKLSRNSTNIKTTSTKDISKLKKSPPQYYRKENNPTGPRSLADPLALSYDPDAEPIEVPDAMGHLFETAERSMSQQLRRAARGNIKSEESDLLPLTTDAHYDIASHDRGGEPSIDALARASATRSSSPVKDLDHCSPSPEDVSFRHGKLSFEEVLQLGGARPASRMSEIAIAVDQYFGGSSEYSEHRPDTQDPVVKAEPNMALNTRAEQHGLKAPNFWGQRELLPEPVPPRRHISDASVHLHNMRISQHLRSFSGLSDDSLLAELSARDQQNVLSHDQRSSSGFGSDGVPRSWGKVLQHPIGRGGLADEDMPTSQFSPRSGQGPKQVASSLIDGHFDGSHPSHVDGPFDQQVEESDRTSSLIPPTSASVQTFGSNYDETTAVWEKALTKHQEERLSPRKRGSSFSNLSRRPSRKGRESSDAQRNSSGETGNVQLPPPDVGLTPFGLKRVNTSLSFDRLSMPSKMFVSQPNSPSVDVDASRRVSNLLSVQDRQRLINSPPANDANTTSELGHQQLLVPGRHESGLTVPEITLSEPIGELPSSSADSYTGPFDHLPLSERPWARYSSEDRELRNGPASELTGDDVKVRDFQPAVEKIESPGSSPTKFDRLRRKEKIKLRAKTVVLKRMLLTDIPTAFKSSNGTFRRREHGHRSSVSTGGNLEYPELELLPSTAPRPATLADDRQFIKTDRRMSTDIPRKTAHHRQTSQQTSSKRFSSPVSSQYGSMTTRSPLQSDSGSQRRTSSFLESTYQKHISDQYRKRSSESISPLDGPDEDVQEAGKHSPGAKSLPARSLAAPVESTGGLIKSQSHQELRRSTQDLNKLLEENWRASLAKALQSAEGPWE